MTGLIAKLHIAFMNMSNEEGQDIIEYILLCSMIAFAATAAIHGLAGNINSAFTSIADKISGGGPNLV